MNSRRNFLHCLSAAAFSASPLASVAAATKSDARRLKFYNTHTRESLDLVYYENGSYIQDSLTRLYILLRDHRQNEAMVMDENLFDQLWQVQQYLGSTDIYEVISGYRSPKTNAMLRAKSSKVARNSYHIKGRAIDIRLRGSKLADVREAALSQRAGGVGYYPNSYFIHLDTGPARNWQS